MPSSVVWGVDSDCPAVASLGSRLERSEPDDIECTTVRETTLTEMIAVTDFSAMENPMNRKGLYLPSLVLGGSGDAVT